MNVGEAWANLVVTPHHYYTLMYQCIVQVWATPFRQHAADMLLPIERSSAGGLSVTAARLVIFGRRRSNSEWTSDHPESLALS